MSGEGCHRLSLLGDVSKRGQLCAADEHTALQPRSAEHFCMCFAGLTLNNVLKAEITVQITDPHRFETGELIVTCLMSGLVTHSISERQEP